MHTSNQLKAYLREESNRKGCDKERHPCTSVATSLRLDQPKGEIALPTELPAAVDGDESLSTADSLTPSVHSLAARWLCDILRWCILHGVGVFCSVIKLCLLWTVSPLLLGSGQPSAVAAASQAPRLLCQAAAVCALSSLFWWLLFPSFASFLLSILLPRWAWVSLALLQLAALAVVGCATRTLTERVLSLRQRSLAAVAVTDKVVKKVQYLSLGYECFGPLPALDSLGDHLKQQAAQASGAVVDRLLFGTRHVTAAVMDELYILHVSFLHNGSNAAEPPTFDEFRAEVSCHCSSGRGGTRRCSLWSAAHFVLQDSLDCRLQEVLRPLVEFAPAGGVLVPSCVEPSPDSCPDGGLRRDCCTFLVQAMGLLRRAADVAVQQMAPTSMVKDGMAADGSVFHKCYKTLADFAALALPLLADVVECACLCVVDLVVLTILLGNVISALLLLNWGLSQFVSRCAAISPFLGVPSDGTSRASDRDGDSNGLLLRRYRKLRLELCRVKADHEAASMRFAAAERVLCSPVLHQALDAAPRGDARELEVVLADVKHLLGTDVESVPTPMAGEEGRCNLALLRTLVADLEELLASERSGVSGQEGASGLTYVCAGKGFDLIYGPGGEVDSDAAGGQSRPLLQQAATVDAELSEFSSVAEQEVDVSSQQPGARRRVLDVYTGTTSPRTIEAGHAHASAAGAPLRSHRGLLVELGLAIQSRNPLDTRGGDGAMTRQEMVGGVARGGEEPVEVCVHRLLEDKCIGGDAATSGACSSDLLDTESAPNTDMGEELACLAEQRRHVQAMALSQILNASVRGSSVSLGDDCCFECDGSGSDDELK
jgi:hypothetical protein